jgi:CO/xanthine dehydrogenase FAD-binding subunit
MFEYTRPQSLDEAVALLAAAGGAGRVLAGGTDLLAQLKVGRIAPERVVDIKRLPELRGIDESDAGFRVGAAVSGAELSEHPGLCAAWPGVVEAAGLIGSTQIQGRASLGGNLCNGSPAADSVPALIAADAVCSVVGSTGSRSIPVQDVIVAPGKTALAEDEIVIDFRLPPRPPHASDAYLRLIPRSEMDIAVVGAGVSLVLDDAGVCTACRVSLGAVAPRPLFVPDAGAALVGQRVEGEALEALAAAARAAAIPIDDMRGTAEYRTHVSGVLARRAAVAAAERAGSQA